MLDPAWEDALRAGQAEDGLSGSVEPELAVVHLLRHARAPEALDDDRLDRTWGAIDDALDELKTAAPVPWWKRPWTLVGGTAAVAAVAAVVLVIVLPGSGPGDDGLDLTGAGAGPIAELGGQADALERQFQILAPGARERVADAVDEDRSKMRDDLLAMALKSGSGTLGGAP